MASIRDRLAQGRRHLVVGREAERAEFTALLAVGELPYCLLNFYGPGGVGKTTLVHAFVDTCSQSNIPVAYLDMRNLESTPDSFLDALSNASIGALDFTVSDTGPRQVLILDTYETAESLDGYLRDVFLPNLSSETIVVLAGRQPLSAAWQSDPGWQPLLHTIALRNLAPEESRQYLVQREVPETRHQEALDFTHGHPLALSLIADVLARQRQKQGNSDIADTANTANTADTDISEAQRFAPEDAPDVIHTLLERFIERIPSDKHRSALEVLALVRHVDEALLGRMLGERLGEPLENAEASEQSLPIPAPVHDIFEWLRGLSFVEASAEGLFPHDIAREALITDLKWRNRDRYVDLHHRARDYYAHQMRNAPGQSYQRLLYDAIFLHRDSAVVRAAFTWHESPSAYPDSLHAGDAEAIQAMVERYEGADSARLAAGWLERQPEATLVFRDLADPSSGPVGFFTLLTLRHDADPEQETDPAVVACLRYLRRNSPLREGEVARYLRFWMARDSYQASSPVESLLIVHSLRQFLLRSSLAFTFFAASDPDLWAPVFEYVEIAALSEAMFTVGGHRYGVYGQDWRTLTANAWLARLFDREVSAGSLPDTAPPAQTALIVLSEPEFTVSVRDALRNYVEPEKLSSNPLLQSRLVVQRTGESADLAIRVESLRSLIRESIEILKESPRSARGFRVLFRTYLEPVANQEMAADLLDLPFSTYRRHLGEGILAVTRRLWQMEIGMETRHLLDGQ